VTREQSVIQIKVVLLIALLALAASSSSSTCTKSPRANCLGLAAITLALGIVYWLMRERDEPAGRRFEEGSKMIRLTTMSFAALLLSSCAMTPQLPRRALGIWRRPGNYASNQRPEFPARQQGRSGGEYSGIAVDLGRDLGKRLGVPVELVAFDTAGKLADAVKAGAWDVAFLGSEPSRANEIAFSAAYLEIEAGYLVPAGSPIRTIAEVDREGCASRSTRRAPTTCISPATCSAPSSSARRPSTPPTNCSSATSSMRSPGSSPAL